MLLNLRNPLGSPSEDTQVQNRAEYSNAPRRGSRKSGARLNVGVQAQCRGQLIRDRFLVHPRILRARAVASYQARISTVCLLRSPAVARCLRRGGARSPLPKREPDYRLGECRLRSESHFGSASHFVRQQPDVYIPPRSRSEDVGQPSRYRLGRLPLDVLENAPCGLIDERV